MIGLRAFYRCRLIQQRHDLTKRPASSSIISPAKVSKCVVISCVSLWASLAHPMRRFISVAERSKQFSSRCSLTSWSPLAAIRKIEVSIVSALLIDDAIACLESSAASFFWNYSLSECQPSFGHFWKGWIAKRQILGQIINWRKKPYSRVVQVALCELCFGIEVFINNYFCSSSNVYLIYFLTGKLSEWIYAFLNAKFHL